MNLLCKIFGHDIDTKNFDYGFGPKGATLSVCRRCKAPIITIVSEAPRQVRKHGGQEE